MVPRRLDLRPCLVALAVLLLAGAPLTLHAQQADTSAAPYAPPIVTGPIHDAPRPSFDQEQLRLALAFDPSDNRLTALATLTLVPLFEPVDTLVLAASGLAVDSVRAGRLDSVGVLVPALTRPGDSLLVALDTLDLALDEPTQVEVFYTATPQQGLFFRPGEAPGSTQIWTEGGPSAPRYWLPTLEHPADNVTTDLIATVPVTHEVVAAGRLVETAPDGDWQTVRYIQDQPQRVDQVLLAIGAFDTVRDTLRLPNGRRLPIAFHLPPGRTASADPTFGRVPEMLRFFSERLGFAYPWPRFTIAAVRDFHPGIQDGTGLLLIDDSMLRDERALLDDTGDLALAEAVARQWVGHAVSPTYWTDRWLVDGLAALLSAAFLEAQQGRRAYLDALVCLRDEYIAETARYHRPLVWDRWTLPDQMADAHSRGKGAWVLHMLREALGDDAFWAALGAFLDQHAFDTADTEDFRRVLEQVAGQSLGDFFDQWVYSAGLPVLDAAYSFEPDRDALALSIEQVQDGDWVRGAFEVSFAAEVHTLLGVERRDLTLTRAEQQTALPAAMRPRFVLLDPDLEVLRDLRLDQPATAWVAQLRYAPLPQHRLQAAQALHAFLDDPALFIGLRSALQGETDPAVRAAILNLLGTLPPSSAAEQMILDACTDEAPTVRIAALNALGRYEGSTEATRCARQRAQSDRSYQVQAAAVRALADLKAPGAVDIVRSALVTPSHGDVIRQAALAVVDSLALPLRERLDLLLEHSEASHAIPVRTQAMAGLAHHPDDRRALSRLIALLDDPSVTIRTAAIRSLAATGSDRAQTALQDHRSEELHRRLQVLLDRHLALRTAKTE